MKNNELKKKKKRVITMIAERGEKLIPNLGKFSTNERIDSEIKCRYNRDLH